MQNWVRIKVSRIAWMINEAPARLRWRMVRNAVSGRLELVTVNGVLDLKLSSGCWVRKSEK